MITISKRKSRAMSRLPALLGGVALLGTLCLPAPRAQAIEIGPVDTAEVAAVIGYVNQAYAIYKSLQALLGGGAPTLAQQLQAMEDKIIGEMRSQRNLALQSQTRTVFNLFQNLADNAKGDPTNDELWTEIITLQQQTADEMFNIITLSGDTQSAYELSPSYFTLITTGTGVLQIKKEIWSNFPSSWNDFYLWLQPGVAAGYKLVGSQTHECYPGFNPGYSPIPAVSSPTYPAWVARMKVGKFKSSSLWNGMEMRWINVGNILRTCQGVSAIVPLYCTPLGCAYPTCPSTPVSSACGTPSDPVGCANRLAKAHFDQDGKVKIIRAGMVGIQKLSGGNDFNAATNNGLLAQGKFVDPWVDEPSCGASGPWAYPHVP
jgi:hypothetical protein